MTDRHKTHPMAVRIPGDLKAWFEEHATSVGKPVNSVVVEALEAYRQAEQGGATTRPAEPARGSTTKQERNPPLGACRHPVNRRIGTYCAICGTTVSAR